MTIDAGAFITKKSAFCAHARELQLDPDKRIPSDEQCPCGYSWKGTSRYVQLNAESRLTARFFAKSHCIGGAAWGCVLCPSSRRDKVENYPSVAALKMHIDVVHSQAQILGERDITSVVRA
jgi:hypothetical protein